MRISFLNKHIGLRLLIVTVLDILLFIPIIMGISDQLFLRFPIHYFSILLVFGLISFYLLRQLHYGYLKGLEGEGDIGLILKQLPETYHSFYNVVLSTKGNIDYVVVGSSGIWTIEVKSTKGTITTNGDKLIVNGYTSKYITLNQPYAEAKSLSDYLFHKTGENYPIHSILVFSNKHVRLRFGEKTIRGVYIIGSRWLNKIIMTNGTIPLSKSEIENITNLLREIKLRYV